VSIWGWLLQWFRQRVHRAPRHLGRIHSGGPQPGPLTSYLLSPLPPAPAKWMPFRFMFWGIFGNDRWGDCTFASLAHCWMALARLLKQPFRLTNNAVISAYRIYCEVYNGGRDAGSYPQTVLQNWHVKGMWGTKLAAWAPIDYTNPEEVRQVIASFGCLSAEVQLPKPAYTYQMGKNFISFKSPVWKLTGTADDNVIVGGHEIAVIGYDTRYIYAVSWGVVVRITPAWWAKYVVGATALVVPSIVTAGGFRGLKIDALEADCAKLAA